jgi:hypothetical protein
MLWLAPSSPLLEHYPSTYTFTMAKNALPGEYQAIVTVSNRVLATTVATPFRVQN